MIFFSHYLIATSLDYIVMVSLEDISVAYTDGHKSTVPLPLPYTEFYGYFIKMLHYKHRERKIYSVVSCCICLRDKCRLSYSPHTVMWLLGFLTLRDTTYMCVYLSFANI